MKFANYLFNAKSVNSMGDQMQIIALDGIYRQMGVPSEKIVYIDKNKLSTYDGEYVILPVTFPLIDHIDNGICGRFSSRIIPLFLCLVLIADTLLPQEVEYYHRFEPIGSRDERTVETLRRYGILCYLHGCVTALLTKRKIDETKHNKVFIVDVPDALTPFIPKKITDNATYLTHFISEPLESPKALALEYLERYRNEAALVITSLLHCATPCIASGIPVIVAKSYLSFRFAWLDKLTHIYEPSEFGTIDWNPSPIDYECKKAEIIELTIDRLWDTFHKYQKMFDVSCFYESRPKREYVVDSFMSIKKYIDEKMPDKLANYEYAIWAVTQMSILTFRYISEHYPNAKLKHVYDTFRQVKFEGIISTSPEKIRENLNEIVFVTTSGAVESAKKLFASIGKPLDTYAFVELVI